MSEIPDAELVASCLAGHREAFAELVERNQRPVFNIAYRMTNNYEDAADLAQDAFVRAYRKLAQYRPEYPFRNWVMTICVNLAKNRFRSVTRRRLAEEAHLEIHSCGEARRSPARDALADALHKLNEKLRIPLLLKHMEGFSYEEVAETLGLGVSAAKMRVKRGREELIRLMKSAEAGGEP